MKSKINSTKLKDIEDKDGNIIDLSWRKDESIIYKHLVKNRASKKGYIWLNYEKVKCNNCNELFLIQKYRPNKTNKYFCSHNCRYNYLTQFQNLLNHKDKYEFYYLLGLIATDGTIRNREKSNSYGISITLQEKDKEIIEKIQKIFNGKINFKNIEKYNINNIKSTNQYTWTVSNKNSWNYLNSIGITANKTLTIDINNFFQTLTYNQKLCFVLGCIDGDGCISKEIKRKTVKISFCSGSIKFINTIFYFIKNDILLKKYNKLSNIKIQIRKSKISSNFTYLFEYGKKELVKIILKELYSCLEYNSLFLSSKYNKYILSSR